VIRNRMMQIVILCAIATSSFIEPIYGWHGHGQQQPDRDRAPVSPWSSFRGNPQNTALAHNRFTKPAQSWVFQPDPPDTIGFYGSPSIDLDGTVYIGSGSVYALDGTTGKKKWEFYAHNAGFYSCPVIGGDGKLYVECYDGNVYAIECKTGKMIWACKLKLGGSSSPALGPNGVLYAGSFDGKLYAIDTTTGKQRWSYQTPAAIYSSPVIGADGTIYFACQ
jgi:outer membrane protein assembly factor BamB